MIDGRDRVSELFTVTSSSIENGMIEPNPINRFDYFRICIYTHFFVHSRNIIYGCETVTVRFMCESGTYDIFSVL